MLHLVGQLFIKNRKYFKDDLNKRAVISCDIRSYRRGDSIDPKYCEMVDICISDIETSMSTTTFQEVCHPRCVCETWKLYIVKHNFVA